MNTNLTAASAGLTAPSFSGKGIKMQLYQNDDEQKQLALLFAFSLTFWLLTTPIWPAAFTLIPVFQKILRSD